MDHLGTGTLVRARFVNARLFAATIPLTALVPVFTLAGRRVHITFAAFFIVATFLYHLLVVLPLVGGSVCGRRYFASGFTLRLERRCKRKRS